MKFGQIQRTGFLRHEIGIRKEYRESKNTGVRKYVPGRNPGCGGYNPTQLIKILSSKFLQVGGTK